MSYTFGYGLLQIENKMSKYINITKYDLSLVKKTKIRRPTDYTTVRLHMMAITKI